VSSSVQNLKRVIPGRDLTSFKLGGELELWQVASSVQLAEVVSHFLEKGVSWRMIGGGSNIIIADRGISDPIVQLSKGMSFSTVREDFSIDSIDDFREERFLDRRSFKTDFESGQVFEVVCGAACQLMSLSRESSAMGLSGLEFAAGIPAQLGGAVKMNAGAHGSSLSEVLTRVWLLDRDCQVVERQGKELGFSYRQSELADGEVVVAAELKLEVGNTRDVMEKRKSSLDYRKKTQPLHMPSAGSIFKNLEEEAAGAIMERNGFGGVGGDGIEFSSMHCNWLVKTDQSGRAESAFSLIEKAKRVVYDNDGLELEPEVLCWVD